MDYYKQGDPANADKIKAAFEKLGIDVLDFGFADKAAVYFSIGGCVQCVPYSINIMNILHSHPGYKELERPVQPKFKDGDVLVTTKIRGCPFIYRKTDYNNNLAYYYVGIDGNGDLSIGWPKRTLCHFGLITDAVIAGQGQRDLLFKKMKEAGYEWDEKKKELRKIIEPKFKVGDKIIWNEPNGGEPSEPVKIIQLIDKDQLYMVDMPNGVGYVAYDMQGYYKLAPKLHYDISSFRAGMPVLVRNCNHCEWNYVPFSHYSRANVLCFRASGTGFKQCIPFEGNEHLLGTTNIPDECYINW